MRFFHWMRPVVWWHSASPELNGNLENVYIGRSEDTGRMVCDTPPSADVTIGEGRYTLHVLGEHGVSYLTCYSARAYRAALRIQAPLFPVEGAALDVLRGAHRQPVKALAKAWSTLGLGDLSPSSHALNSLRNRGLVEVEDEGHYREGAVVTVKAVSGRWATRYIPKASMKHDNKPDPELWSRGEHASGNPLLASPWWEVVGWPAHRGGRPAKG